MLELQPHDQEMRSTAPAAICKLMPDSDTGAGLPSATGELYQNSMSQGEGPRAFTLPNPRLSKQHRTLSKLLHQFHASQQMTPLPSLICRHKNTSRSVTRRTSLTPQIMLHKTSNPATWRMQPYMLTTNITGQEGFDRGAKVSTMRTYTKIVTAGRPTETVSQSMFQGSQSLP